MTSLSVPVPQTFRAADMPAALEEIQRVLGPEALIVSVRQAPAGAAWQVWKKPGVEVVAMGMNAPAALAAAPAAPQTSAADIVAQLARQIATPREGPVAATPTRAEAASAASVVKPVTWPVARSKTAAGAGAPVMSQPTPLASQRSPAASAPARASQAPAALQVPSDAVATAIQGAPALASLYDHLLSQGLDLVLARKVVTVCADTIGPEALQDLQRVRWHLEQQLEGYLRTQAAISVAAQHIICLIGATGCGKTTATARLARYFGRQTNSSVAWIAADTMRAGAIAQARAFADALKLPLRVAYGPDELAQAVAAEQTADLVLVDLPGCNPRSEAGVTELGNLLAALPRRATYWVAAATAKETDLTGAYAAFAPFHLNGLLVTKLDETSTFGPVFNLAWRTRLPLSFFATGPRVLDTLQPATPESLVRALFEGEFRA
jgi:flagellar biosynthesis protein FlhF